MSVPTYGSVEIIANLDTCYTEGDRVAVALADSVLKDATTIKPTNLRGLAFFGMALSIAVEEVGTDLLDRYCQNALANVGPFIKWPSIELLHNLCRSFEYVEEKPTLIYRAKVKKPVQVDPEKVQGINEFVTLFVTEARLEQEGMEARDSAFNMKKMGMFLKWFTNDVQKESKAELEAAQLTWKEVNKAVMNTAREWCREKATSL